MATIVRRPGKNGQTSYRAQVRQRTISDHLCIDRLAFGTKNKNWADGVSDS